MFRPHLIFLLLFSLTIKIPKAQSDAVIRTGVNKDQAQQQDAKVFDATNVKGIANYEGEEGFNRNNENKHVQAQDSGNYNEANGQKNVHSDQAQYQGDKSHQQAAGEEAEIDQKSANKKGHHKSGYTKTFHKDESASTSSYYDDSDNEGGERVRSSKKNNFADSGQQSQRGVHYDDKKFLQDQEKKGGYDTAGNYQKDLANQQNYNSKKYLDNRANEGVRNSASSYAGADRYNGEHYERRPHQPYYDQPYYDNRPPLPPLPQKTITIYEDPRYEGYEKYPQYDNDYIHLDVRRPAREYERYYDRRPPYDYYY